MISVQVNNNRCKKNRSRSRRHWRCNVTGLYVHVSVYRRQTSRSHAV